MINCAHYTSERRQVSLDTIHLPLSLKQEHTGDGMVASPLVQNGICIIETAQRRLVCLDNQTFTPLWETKSQEWASVPVADENRLYIKNFSTSQLVTIDLHTGERVKTEDNIGNIDQFIVDGRIYYLCYLANDNCDKVICKNCNSHETIWEYVIDNEFYPDTFSGNASYICIKNEQGSVITLDVLTGKLRWLANPISIGIFKNQHEIDQLANDDADFTLKNLKYTSGYATIYDNIFVTPNLNNYLVGLDLINGHTLWKVRSKITHNFTRQAYSNEIYAMGNGYIESWDMLTGEQTRCIKIDVGEYEDKVTPFAWRFTVSETHIYATIPNFFYAVNKESGKVDWMYEPDKQVTESDQPYIANGRIYFRTLSGMYVFEGRDGYIPPSPQ